MKQIFIDKFIIPAIAFEEFSNRMNYNRSFIKNIPGFIKDSVYKGMDDQNNIIIITIAEWQDEISLNAAKELVQSEYKKINFNPAEMMTRLNIKMERGIFNELSDS
jgi:heme-degrading monooxygenase HmoA